MVKLIRITSEDNGNYNAELQDGILLNPQSSIALQNLTFESDFIGLNINNGTNEISFNLDVGDDQTGIPAQPGHGYQPTPPFSTISAVLKTEQYTKTNYKDFFNDLQGALNSCLSVGTGASENYGDIYSEFFIDSFSNPDRPKIYYKYSPQIMMFHMNDSTPREDETEMFLISEDEFGDALLEIDETVSAELLGNIQQPAAATGTSELTNYIIPNYNSSWCRGSAVYGCSVYNIDDSQPGNPGTHGFAIGLSFTKNLNGTMPDSHRDFEIHIEKGNQPYKFISPAIPNTEQISTTDPYTFNITTDPGILAHDRIIFERKAGVITGSIWATGTVALPGTPIRHELFSYTLTDDQRYLELYPYVWVKGSSLNATVGRPFLTPSTLIYDVDLDPKFLNMDFEVTGNRTTADVLGGQNYFQELVSSFYTLIPHINNNRMFLDIQNKPRVVLDGNVLRFLGYDVVGNTPINIDYPLTQISADSVNNELGFILEGDQNIQLVNSDNYVVVIDSNPVMSYDASKFSYGVETTLIGNSFNQMKGRQFNILSTIAVNDNVGYVEWRANNLVFIDFDNKYPLELKNLRLRVLDKELNPIKQIGLGVITLLIKDK
jgi:hypothetical protein